MCFEGKVTAPRAVKHPTKQAGLTKSGELKREKQKKKGGGGAAMYHNKLQPSKVAKEWRNIPFFAHCNTFIFSIK